jgi:hypothetical protein
MEGIRLRFHAGIIAAAFVLVASGCGGDPEPDPVDPGPPLLLLKRAPAEMREACREIAADASTTIYCPTRMPPVKHGKDYLEVKEMRNVSGDAVVGVTIYYTAKKQPALQNTRMHMYFAPTGVLPYLPKKSRHAEIGDRRGTFYPAIGHDPDDNHFNFSCRLGSPAKYWVSVHSVGRGSRQLLDAMVRELEPVSPSA